MSFVDIFELLLTLLLLFVSSRLCVLAGDNAKASVILLSFNIEDLGSLEFIFLAEMKTIKLIKIN